MFRLSQKMTRGSELVDINKSYVSENGNWQLQSHLQRINHRDTRANLRNYVRFGKVVDTKKLVIHCVLLRVNAVTVTP